MKMAYIATNPETLDCYAIASADPNHMDKDTVKDILKWKRDGAIVELLPADEARKRLCESLPPKREKQLTLLP